MLSGIARLLLVLARSAGLVGALSSVVLWVTFLSFIPYSSPVQGFDSGPYVTAAMMVVLAVAAAWAVVKIKPIILLGAFVGSFPFGLYLMGTPTVLKWTGVCNLLYLVALVLILGARLENHEP